MHPLKLPAPLLWQGRDAPVEGISSAHLSRGLGCLDCLVLVCILSVAWDVHLGYFSFPSFGVVFLAASSFSVDSPLVLAVFFLASLVYLRHGVSATQASSYFLVILWYLVSFLLGTTLLLSYCSVLPLYCVMGMTSCRVVVMTSYCVEVMTSYCVMGMTSYCVF